ncbi:hypothetical protein P5673_020982 [Acropora cervicornis]|uniref:Condensation domain-containing protein n=1 Tax=Acropora cervicornis TaxID=6130 RepID=A0AAD9Q8Z1_ACRCE|nr:hypothetical protein P5673_020982 [Acropora cervicornis]
MSSILVDTAFAFIICLLLVASFILLFIAKKFMSERTKPKGNFTIQRVNNMRLSRRLGKLEQVLFEREKTNNWGTVSSVLLLDSTQELSLDLLKRALNLLTKRYPLLRMRVKDSADNQGLCFEEMENPEKIDFQVSDTIKAGNWTKGLEEELNSYLFDIENGPLWRVKLLGEITKDGKFRNALLFTFQHVICDALSIFELQKYVMRILSSLHSGKHFEVECLPFRPPLETFISRVAQPNIFERLLFSTSFMLQKLKVSFFKPKNSFLSLYPPVANTEPSVTKKTCLLTRALGQEETERLIQSCKANRCTVHGAITASTHSAIAGIMQRERKDFKNPLSVKSSYSINMRKYCEPTVNSTEFGAFVSATELSIAVPVSNTNDMQGFWNLAGQCTREVHSQIKSGKHRNLLKFYQCVDIPTYCKMSNYEHNQGRRSHICNINNYGSHQLPQAENSSFKFAGTYLGVQAAKTGHIFGNNLMTVDNRLYWAVEYFPHVTTKEQAEEFFNLSLSILKQMSIK